MDNIDLDEVRPSTTEAAVSPLKDWRLKFQADTIKKQDFLQFFQKESRKYFDFKYEEDSHATRRSLKCCFNDDAAKTGMIDVVLEFMLGDKPDKVLNLLQKEGSRTSVCGKVFKTGEPTYSCRECGMDPTCVLCVNCFKQSAHRFHKYKMSTSGGGGCCDCGDEEAWKRDHYCEEHLRGKEHPAESAIITKEMIERCEIVFMAMLSFCVNYLEIETNASLECLDGDGDGDDYFCTVLYNDESHTFDQVIQILTKIAKCRHKDAMEIVASIDREGRAVVKCDTFFECTNLKCAIEKQSVATAAGLPLPRANLTLRVNVLHICAVACQQFALLLLSWFQEFVVRHATFRRILAQLLLDPKAPYSIKHILEYDVKLWKTARTSWHRLLISGMLMEYENKKALAVEFSRHYATVMQDFIRDDHEHSFSVVSLSVQLFTVPSIAHYLIANESIYHKLLHTFYHGAIKEYIQNKKLHFTKGTTSSSFKRAAYILYDLRYILSFKPDEWDDDLRDGFIEGCKALLVLMNVMQGMESMTRQTGQHMDYEPEWECAFNLHIKLANVISLVLKWASSDARVLTKLYQMVMRYMMNNGFIVNEVKPEEKTVLGHVATCLMYDVASKPVSIHLPLSRFFAGVYLNLGSFGLTFDNAITGTKRTPEELMEPILCTQVMVAQVHAGMWRRNGYSLLHQLYFYRNVRCRVEMLDKDIVGMQIGAAMIESNQYLIHVLNKFNLIDWVQKDYEKGLTICSTDDEFIRLLAMIDEFLELLIVIIGERYMQGVAHVTEEDCIRKEIIQLLCIKNYSHSELSRNLPETNDTTVLEDVIDTVANFKKPQQYDPKGVYELKEELYDDYNLYYYHFTKEDKSKSEETQRLRRKQKGELVCCPPPKLPKLTDGFVSIANLLQCDIMLNIYSVVLERGLDLNAKCFQENHLQKVLHLIGYALQEEQSGNYPFLSFCERSESYGILPKLEELSRSARVEGARDFILWTIRKFKEVQASNAKEQQIVEDEPIAEEPMTLPAAEQEKKEKEERARLAAERRAKILAQIQSQQKSFMKSYAEEFAAEKANEGGAMEWEVIEENAIENINEEGAAAYNSVACLGIDRRLQQPEDEKTNCIMCSGDCEVTKEGSAIVYSAFIQKSRVLRPEKHNPAYLYVNTCGHVMHIDCWRAYYAAEELKEQRRPTRNRPNVTNNIEFQCPYCRCLSNIVFPLTPPLSKFSTPIVLHADEDIFSFSDWLKLLKVLLETFCNRPTALLDLPGFEFLLATMGGEQVEKLNAMFLNAVQFTTHNPVIDGSKSWTQSIQKFATALVEILSGETYDITSSSQSPHQALLGTCIYTVQAIEMYLRAVKKPLKCEMSIRHKSCLRGLIRASCVQSAFLEHSEIRHALPKLTELLLTVMRHNDNESLITWNCFDMMASLIFMSGPVLSFSERPTRSIIPSGSQIDYYTLQLFFVANITKALLLYNAEDEKISTTYQEMEIDDEEMSQQMQREKLSSDVLKLTHEARKSIIALYKKCNLPFRKAQEERKEKHEPAYSSDFLCSADDSSKELQFLEQLFSYIKREMFEFLRCACIFFHFITDVDFPDNFPTTTGCEDNFDDMCKYLGLDSNLSTYLAPTSIYCSLIDQFINHPDIRDCIEVTRVAPCMRQVPQLVKLPEDYSELINSVSAYVCPKNDRDEMKSPMMCLVCGDVLCGQSYCCQPELDSRGVGACTYHANKCGADIGAFLRIRECQVVCLGRNKGCLISAPYLDEYGETDPGLRRGNPLRLCATRYNKLHLQWLGHGLHEEIARLNDGSTVAMTQWHHI